MGTKKLTTIRLGGQLGKKFGRVHKFYVSSVAEAIRMLCVNFEGFERYLRTDQKTLYKVFVAGGQIDPETELHMHSGRKDIVIAPVIHGSKNGGLFQVVLGVVLIAASWWAGGAAGWGYLGAAGAANTLATGMFMAGFSMALGGVASLLSTQPSLTMSSTSADNTPNKNFSNGPTNTTAAGVPVPLVYGEILAGSATISAGTYSSDLVT